MKIFNWLKESNRLSHLKVGFAIWALFMLFSLSMCSFFENNVELNNTYGKMMVLLSTFGADFSMLSSMCSVEYAQKLCGNKWDWLDILAGCLSGIILSLIIILVMFI